MRLSHLAAAAAAFALVAAPALAAPMNRALKLSLNSDPAEEKDGGSELAGAGAATFLLAGLGVAAVVAGAVALGSSDNTPASM